MRRKHVCHLPGHINDALKGFTHGGGVTVHLELPDSNAFWAWWCLFEQVIWSCLHRNTRNKKDKKSQTTCVQCNYRVSRAPLLSYLLLLGLEPHEWTPLFPFLHSKHQITISNRFALSLFGALYLCTSHTPRTASSFPLLYLQLLSVMESEAFSEFIDLLKKERLFGCLHLFAHYLNVTVLLLQNERQRSLEHLRKWCSNDCNAVRV